MGDTSLPVGTISSQGFGDYPLTVLDDSKGTEVVTEVSEMLVVVFNVGNCDRGLRTLLLCYARRRLRHVSSDNPSHVDEDLRSELPSLRSQETLRESLQST